MQISFFLASLLSTAPPHDKQQVSFASAVYLPAISIVFIVFKIVQQM
jgi:hypothetical protein